ncbi:MAG: iron-containing alcohol dehydrogenase [Clostridia bacterium]|nr:iron-containing alcohol dehydrogenase [Clostridia bacterium]
MNYDYYLPTKVISGRGAVKDNYALFKNYGRKCLIVTGAHGAESQAFSDVKAALVQNKIEFEVYSKIRPNPETTVCCRAGAKARDMGASFIVGIGGGSSLDAAKAVSIYAHRNWLRDDEIYSRQNSADHLPVILVGTTAGTGSEVTGVSVLTDRLGHKRGVHGPDCYATVSFCDYSYTETCPMPLTITCALDAFAHSAEGFLCSDGNDLTDLFALRAFSLLMPELKKLSQGSYPSSSSREFLYAGSIYAGLVINKAGTGFPHRLSYILTEDYGIPHGAACTAFFPLLLERAQQTGPDRVDRLLRSCKTDKQELLSLIASLTGDLPQIDQAAAENYRPRFEGEIANFNRSPGGFSASDAVNALSTLW